MLCTCLGSGIEVDVACALCLVRYLIFILFQSKFTRTIIFKKILTKRLWTLVLHPTTQGWRATCPHYALLTPVCRTRFSR